MTTVAKMNERIKELAEQATTSIKDEYGHWIGSELDEEKFAELIIREYSYDVMNLHGASPARVEMAAKHWGVEL